MWTDALVLVAIDVQDPGNVGALVRTGEAGGMTGMFVCGASANPFSWKAIRGSMGSVLRVPIVAGMTTASVMTCLRSGGIRTVAAVPRGGEDPDTIDWRGRVALILGGEGGGVPDEITQSCDRGRVDSDGCACGILERRRGGCHSRVRGPRQRTGPDIWELNVEFTVR